LSRYTGPKCRLCRAEGIKLFLKGDRCYTEKCPVAGKRNFRPGQHGREKPKLTDYGLRLREKQKLRRFYGVSEKQFKRFFDIAQRMRGEAGYNFLQLLERRLDNVVYRLGFAVSRAQARQLVAHGHVEVNGRKVDIPSFLVKVGDVVGIREKSRDLQVVKESLEGGGAGRVPAWLELDQSQMRGRVVSLPARDQIDAPVNEQLVVEFYSR